MVPNPSAVVDNDAQVSDLGPLAWVLEELRKSLDGATRAMHRFVRDAELARGSELSELDTSHLRVARQQLHQAVGALEMVGMPAPAKLLQAMEAAVQKFVQRPELCSDDAANRIERASFALSEYLEGLLKGKQASSVALFPQYRAVMELAGADRIHPADLWALEWRWQPVALQPEIAAMAYAPVVRARLDQAVLKIVKSSDPRAATRLAHICAGLAAAQTALEPRSFWAIAAGYFEAMGLSLLPADIYIKRTASRILQQYANMAKGESGPSERLAQDLIFFCAQAQVHEGHPAPLLAAVRAAYAQSDTPAVDYDTEQFGRFDPAQLVLVRKRIAAAAETWSALAGGDTHRLKLAGEQFGAVTDSILKLHPQSSALAQALTSVLDATLRAGVAPEPAVAMEVATAILYLEAAYEDLDPTHDQMAERSARLANRLQQVQAGAEPEPLEAWMEELYRRVSDRQTMGSVVDELRSSLGEAETALDKFFRNPTDKSPLRDVPSRLAQMRGVFSVLGLDQPAIACLRMRTSVERLLVDDVDAALARSGVFEKLGNSLGALGLLIDMLSYQRAMAKKLFVYDEETGEFKPLMGRSRSSAPAPLAVEPEAATPAPLLAEPFAASASLGASVGVPTDEDDEEQELQDIFLEEAREVVAAGLVALRDLAAEPSNLADQTTLRRAFHTLKGSSRMVGLNDFGEAAWACEQMLNAWLAEQKPASNELITLSSAALLACGRWLEDIAADKAQDWSPAPFRASTDALRLEGRYLPLQLGDDTDADADAVRTVVLPSDATVLMEALATEVQTPGDDPDFVSTQSSPLLSELDLPEASEAPVVDEPAEQTEPTAAPEVSELPEVPEAPDAPDAPDAPAVPEPLSARDFVATSMLGDLDSVAPAEAEDSVADLELNDFDFGDIGNGGNGGNGGDSSEGPETLLNRLAPPEWSRADEQDAQVTQLVMPSEFEPDTLAPESELLAEFEPEPPVQPEVQPEPQAEPEPVHQAEEQLKVIGDLRLGIPLYNIFLNEADEWSRRLQVELSEWSLELPKPLADSSVALAHSLGGIAATVGFTALAEVARTLEHALEHVQLHNQGTAQHAQVFNDAAEEIRRLLHQFAAGFLKPAEPAVLQALKDIIATEFAEPEAVAEALDEVDAVDFVDAADVVEAVDAAPEMPLAHADAATLATPIPAPAPTPTEVVARDHLDTDLFPIFQEEAMELMPALGTALRQWVARPENMGARAEALRVLHTLKGSARLAGAMRLGEMAHQMESGIEMLGVEDLQAAQLELLLSELDQLQNTLDALDLAPREDVSLAQPESDMAQDLAVGASGPASLPGAATASAAAIATATAGGLGVLPAPVPLDQVTRHSVRSATALAPAVRVRTQLLDRLVNQAGEVMISRSRLDTRVVQMRSALGELGGNLERLRQQLRDVEVQAESQMQSRLAQNKDDAQAFDPLEFDRFTRVQELTRMMAESVNDVATVQRNLQRSVEGAEDDLNAQGRQARELQRDLLRTRMVEFEGIAERLYGVVRQAAKESDKQVKLEIEGGNIEMDRGVLDRMTPAFEHILRNAVAHGIESAAVRAEAGKPAVGSVRIRVHQESNDVSVTFSDDGGGLHLDKIRAKALASHLISPDQHLSDEAAAQLLFTPGFSTATEVTELSGRGIGMDVVLTELNALGGLVETQTQIGAGTSFRLVLPLTTAVTQVVMLRMGELTFGVPSNLVETVLRAPTDAVQAAYANGTYTWLGQEIPFYWGGALLQVSGHSSEEPGRSLPVAVLRSAGQRVALHVDEVLGNREVVVKNLGPQLARLPGLAGMSVLASGAVVLIYNPVALATVYGANARALSGNNASAPATGGAQSSSVVITSIEQAPLVLVVDDSITVRRVTQRLLKREGFRVALANDGLHALEVLAHEKPTVVLSDIEMPRMDGFDLLRNIRADEKLRDLPVIMITSRIAQKHRDHAMELGVDHYLGKPYSEDELLALIRSYCPDTVIG